MKVLVNVGQHLHFLLWVEDEGLVIWVVLGILQILSGY